jgi:outer membrane protein insertion porin family
MPRIFRLFALLALTPFLRLDAQTVGADPCLRPDSVVMRGLARVTAAEAVSQTGLLRGQELSVPVIQRAVRRLYESGHFEEVTATCEVITSESARLVFTMTERPVLASVNVFGTDRVSERSVNDRIDLFIRRPVDPALVTRAVTRIDSLYEASGYYLTQIRPDTVWVDSASIALTFRIDEGRRLAISQLLIDGNAFATDKEIVKVLKTKPEGFWWFRKGEYDEDRYIADLGERLPMWYAERGFIDFQVNRDTLIVDRERGKGVVEIDLTEGPAYAVGTFSLNGNRHFTDEDLRRYFPFGDAGPTVTERALNLLRGKTYDPDRFDRARWEEAVVNIQGAYQNDGYIYAQIEPVLERTYRADSTPVVNMRLEITERAPAIVNRVDIIGNDFTVDNCIRSAIQLIPGGVFSRDRMIRSFQNLQNMGFFETPMREPRTEPDANGDLDVTFDLTEKRTGNINFGASMGQGVGVGGFIGLEQPNLFGRCKRGSLNWQYGRFINDFNLSYTDPSIRLSPFSGTVSIYRSQARFQIADLGQSTRIGGSVRVGLPIPGTFYSRVFLSYTGEGVEFGTGGLLGTVQAAEACVNCTRSSVALDVTRDARFGLPFPTSGSLQQFSAQFNGGPLGGTANFQRYTAESRAFVPLYAFGGQRPGSQPVELTMGLSTRTGATMGNTGPFFFSQRFALGGVQFGEPLRGYPEFSITPRGFLAGTGTFNAQRESFGSAFFATTAEIGIRFNAQFYLNVFYDAGNVWERPEEFDPTRLFRGAGIGLSTVTPLGPLGLDWAYGFDRVDAFGRRDPQFQLHFRLGQLF